MNRIFVLPVAVALAAAGRPATADDQADARAIIDKALKAIGGEEKATKLKAAVWTAKGKVQGIEFRGTWSVELPHRSRVVVQLLAGGMSEIGYVGIMNGRQGWTFEYAFNREPSNKDLKEIDPENTGPFYAGSVEGLTTLRDNAFTLSVLKDGGEVGGRPVVGVRVIREDREPVHLYFDRDSGLLVKSAVLKRDRVHFETIYSDYKDFDGLKHPTKAACKMRQRPSSEPEPFMEYEITEFKWYEKLDDKLFEKPDIEAMKKASEKK